MGDSMRGQGLVCLAGACVLVVLGVDVAEARPFRGPLGRAERRLARAQATLERELARPQGRARAEVQPAEAGRVPAAATPAPAPTQVKSPPALVPPPTPQAAARAPEPRPAVNPASPQAKQPELARTAFESPVPASVSEPAADGTVSVLVRPGAEAPAAKAAQPPAGDPLLFPESAKP